MLRIFTDDHYFALTLNHFAFFANRLYGRSYFHLLYLLLASPGDAAARQIIRRHLNRDLVTGEDSDKVHPELSGDVRQDDVAVADINPERRVGQGFDDRALQFDYIVFCQGI